MYGTAIRGASHAGLPKNMGMASPFGLFQKKRELQKAKQREFALAD